MDNGEYIDFEKVEQQDVPEGVENFEQYEMYLKLKDHPLMTEKRIVYLGDGEMQVDLCASSDYIQKMVVDLEIDQLEKNRIIALNKCARSILGKISAAKRRAYGSLRNAAFTDKEVLSAKRAEVLELFGRFYTITEVHRIVTQEWGISISHRGVREFRVRNLEKITKLQDEYKKNYTDIRLTHKRGRLDELVWMYNERKTLYFQNNRSRDDQKELRTILEQVRKEVEVDRLVIEGSVDVNIEATIAHHIQKEVLTDLSLLDIIVSRVAAKRAINPQAFIFQLHNSYYAKYNGIEGIEGEEFNNEKIYPSALIYDFEKLKQLTEAKSEENKKLRAEKMLPKSTKPADRLREMMKKKLAEKQIDLNRSVDRVDRREEDPSNIEKKKE